MFPIRDGVFVFLFTSIWICLYTPCNGSCFVDKLRFEMTASGRLRYFCEFKESSGSKTEGSSLVLLPGSTIYLGTSCLECTCSEKGLSCCGFGRNSGIVRLPDDCMEMADGCQSMYVKKVNKSLECFTGEPLDTTGQDRMPHPDNQLRQSRQGVVGQAPAPKMMFPSPFPLNAARTIQLPVRLNLASFMNSLGVDRKSSPAGTQSQSLVMSRRSPTMDIFKSSAPSRGQQLKPMLFKTQSSSAIDTAPDQVQQDFWLPWLLMN